MNELELNGNVTEDEKDWLEGWGSLTEEPSYEEREIGENETRNVEPESTYEGGLALLDQLAEQFGTEPSQDYCDSDRMMIASIMCQAREYALNDEKKDADTVGRALRMRLADADNALMLMDKYQFSPAQKEAAFATRRNAQRALDEYVRAYGDVSSQEEFDHVETSVPQVEDETPVQNSLTLPGDVIS